MCWDLKCGAGAKIFAGAPQYLVPCTCARMFGFMAATTFHILRTHFAHPEDGMHIPFVIFRTGEQRTEKTEQENRKDRTEDREQKLVER